MHFYKEYTQPSEDPDKPDKIKKDSTTITLHENTAFTENPA